ncbi:DUF3465 domain-containing protein [Shewanella sp. OMA3-2]|uniref:DUF3465 domain-containing protein n=1 Tax=Shewanella sp. OMA3-2 TaxID=2908650 RepID=UPI001F36BE18|nr:DUF3465 domain-containing protein [Shewanella sp. OMA3-2]UJF22413.1 DUF3465 domain-containing protein [Shewanella sp. OMA3-2]
MKKIIVLLLICSTFYQLSSTGSHSAIVVNTPAQSTTHIGTASVNESASISATQDAIAHAYENKRSNVQVKGVGKVIKLLADDNQGSRHQKFILQLPSGQTLLIAHNIDLAPRINTISIGDQITFYGQYEWNDNGGVVHWTHRDPNGRHIGGWLQHNGQTYQ